MGLKDVCDRRKFIIFHLKDDNGKLWVEMIIVTSLDAVATVDVTGTEHMITGHRTKGVVLELLGRCLLIGRRKQ